MKSLNSIKCNFCSNSPALTFNSCGCYYCKDCAADTANGMLVESIATDTQVKKVVSPPFSKVEDVCLACGNAVKYRFDLNKLRSLNAYLKACGDGKAKTPMAAEGSGTFAFLHNVLNVY